LNEYFDSCRVFLPDASAMPGEQFKNSIKTSHRNALAIWQKEAKSVHISKQFDEFYLHRIAKFFNQNQIPVDVVELGSKFVRVRKFILSGDIPSRTKSPKYRSNQDQINTLKMALKYLSEYSKVVDSPEDPFFASRSKLMYCPKRDLNFVKILGQLDKPLLPLMNQLEEQLRIRLRLLETRFESGYPGIIGWNIGLTTTSKSCYQLLTFILWEIAIAGGLAADDDSIINFGAIFFSLTDSKAKSEDEIFTPEELHKRNSHLLRKHCKSKTNPFRRTR